MHHGCALMILKTRGFSSVIMTVIVYRVKDLGEEATAAAGGATVLAAGEESTAA